MRQTLALLFMRMNKAWLCRLALLLLLLFFRGLVEIYAQFYPSQVEHVEYLHGFSQDRLESKVQIGLEGSASARYTIDLGKEKWYQKTTILDAFYKPLLKDDITFNEKSYSCITPP